MAVMFGELYNALIEAGAPNENAREASAEVASIDGKLSRLDASMEKLGAKVDSIEIRCSMLQWMLGINMAMTATIMFRLFS